MTRAPSHLGVCRRHRPSGITVGAVKPLVVVDAANVMGSRPDGWWRDRAAAVRRLLDTISGHPTSADVILVVEGIARAGVEPGQHNGIQVVHAAGSGDDEIVRITGESAGDRAVTVVTADRALRTRVTSLGATVEGPRHYLEHL